MKTEDKVLSTSLTLINDAVWADIQLAKELERRLVKKEKAMFRDMARQHSDVLNLLDTVIRRNKKSKTKAESYFSCVERLIKQNKESHEND